ncbi:MAG: superoxide dismutase family protein [Oscillospiraceae bacterium]|nr:superoxide dismutase family protein [Oscillospiraceae bacterium]
MDHTRRISRLISLLHQRPHATALLRGSEAYPGLQGRVDFYQTRHGVWVAAEIQGLPFAEESCEKRVFGFHIHSGTSCSGTEADPFADALTHYNPQNCPHPAHAGDLPPLFGCGNYACQLVLTDRFTVREIIGRTVIIHSQPDDFHTQPSGNSGQKIACGVIQGCC